jgi:hypothetical protein
MKEDSPRWLPAESRRDRCSDPSGMTRCQAAVASMLGSEIPRVRQLSANRMAPYMSHADSNRGWISTRSAAVDRTGEVRRVRIAPVATGAIRKAHGLCPPAELSTLTGTAMCTLTNRLLRVAVDTSAFRGRLVAADSERLAQVFARTHLAQGGGGACVIHQTQVVDRRSKHFAANSEVELQQITPTRAFDATCRATLFVSLTGVDPL